MSFLTIPITCIFYITLFVVGFSVFIFFYTTFRFYITLSFFGVPFLSSVTSLLGFTSCFLFFSFTFSSSDTSRFFLGSSLSVTSRFVGFTLRFLFFGFHLLLHQLSSFPFHFHHSVHYLHHPPQHQNRLQKVHHSGLSCKYKK